MHNISPHLFDNALNFLYNRNTKIHYQYVINNIKDGYARLVVEKLINEGLISKDSSDYYKITEIGRDVVNSGGYRNFEAAKKYHGFGSELADIGISTNQPRTINDNSIEELRKQYIEQAYKMANPRVSRKTQFIDFLAHPTTKTILQSTVWLIAIVTFIFSLVKWVLPYLKK